MSFLSYRQIRQQTVSDKNIVFISSDSLSQSEKLLKQILFSTLSPKKIKEKRVERTWKIPSFSRGQGEAEHGCAEGSLTIEAALALTLFLFFVLSLCWLFVIMQTKLRFQQALEQVSSEAAQFAYVSSQAELWDSQSVLIGKVEDFLLTELGEEALRLRFLAVVGEEYVNSSCVLGGASGVGLEGDPILEEDGKMRLILSYRIRLPLAVLGNFTFTMRQQSYRYAWIGDRGIVREAGDALEGEQVVYVTEGSQVYHLTMGCSYLNLTVRQVPFLALEGLRNGSGGRYYACELCRPDNGGSGMVYITEDGSRYHGDRQCSGLKRSVTALPLSQAGDRRPCSRCGSLAGDSAADDGEDGADN